MRIAHLTSVHDALDGRIFSRECRSLARAGYDVVIVAPARAADAPREADGVRILTVRAPRNRLERMIVTGPAVAAAALRERADVYHFHDPELIGCGLWLRLMGKRVVYDAHEDVPKDVAQKRYIPAVLRRPVAFAAGLVSRVASRAFSASIAAVPAIADGLSGRRVIIRNYPVLDELVDIGGKPWRSRTRAATYSGLITESRGIREMVAAMSSVRMPAAARLTLAGRFDDAALQAALAREPSWKRIELAGWLSGGELWRTLADAKIGIVTLHATPTFIDSLPTKLFEYMALGLPVVASDFPLWRTIVTSCDCGLLVDPRDPEAIAAAIAELLAHPKRAETMGANGRAAVAARYSWDREAQRLLSLYADLCSGRRRAVNAR